MGRHAMYEVGGALRFRFEAQRTGHRLEDRYAKGKRQKPDSPDLLPPTSNSRRLCLKPQTPDFFLLALVIRKLTDIQCLFIYLPLCGGMGGYLTFILIIITF